MKMFYANYNVLYKYMMRNYDNEKKFRDNLVKAFTSEITLRPKKVSELSNVPQLLRTEK